MGGDEGFEVAESPNFIDTYNNNAFSDDDDSFVSDSFESDSDSEISGSSGNDDDEDDGSVGQVGENQEIEELARRETANVRAWRLIVLLVIIITGGVVTTGTFLFLKREERVDAKESVRVVVAMRCVRNGTFPGHLLPLDHVLTLLSSLPTAVYVLCYRDSKS